MIAERESCLDRDTIRNMLSGKLPVDRFQVALEHVESCNDCRKASEQGDNETLGYDWMKLADSVEQSQFDHEPECQAVVGNLLARDRAVRAESPEIPVDQLGPYRIQRLIGSGGMGTVYAAKHERLNRLAAIKVSTRRQIESTRLVGAI